MSFGLKATILGSGSSGGVPRIGGADGRGEWGACDPKEPRNRRRRCSLLVERGTTQVLVDTTPLLLVACDREPPHPPAEGAHAPAADFERGPHRGRLLRDGAFALEVTIFETGVPPEYRLYAYQDDKPLPASAVKATIDLSRLDGEKNHFEFAPQGDVLVGNGTVTEPHSFDVVVVAQHGGKTHRWKFESYEGRTAMPAAVAEAAGVRTERAGPATIHDRVRLMGPVALNANRFAPSRLSRQRNRQGQP